MYCFGNGSEELKCKYCGMRESEAGIKKKLDIPEIQVYKKELLIKFGAEVIAQEFAGYFGEIQNRVLRRDTEEIVVVDLSETRYINHFCISKILLTLFACKDYKKIKLCLPSSKNKMLRYIYNLGILDYIFECNYIDIYVSDKKIDSYNDIYDFSECYDHSILPYYIYEFCKDENIDLYEQEKRTIENCLSAVRNYFCKEKEQPEKYSKVESRLYLYLQEIIDNVFTHAYGNEKRVFFAINIYNSYLPPYAVYKGTKEEKKFQNRISKFQKNVPMSIYKDIQDRYFGGFNVFIDDIGDGIASTYMLERNENIYRDVYINGSKKRQTINGLKLVADQIAINKDILWAHDTRWWIGTSFIENSSICIQDSSRMLYY